MSGRHYPATQLRQARDEPDVNELPQVAAALVVTFQHAEPVATSLQVIRVVDWYRDDLYRRSVA